MALIFSQESGESKNLSQVNSYTVTTEPGAIYRLADDATGTMPGDLKLSRQGDDLVLSSQSGNANVVMKGFWGGSEQSYLVLNLSGGEFVLTSEGLNLDAMSAGAEGTLADGTSIALAGPTADKNDSIENSIDEPEKPTDTRIPGDTDNNGKLDNADDAGKPQVKFVDDRPAPGQTSGDGILNRTEVGTDGKTTVQVDFPISGNYRGGDKVTVMVNGKPLLDNGGQPVVVTLEPVAPNDPGQGVKPITIDVPVNNDGPLKVEVEVRNPNSTLQDPPVVKSSGQVNVDTHEPVISDVIVEQHDTSDPADMTPEKTVVKFKGDDPTATYTVTGPNGEKAKVTGPDADGNYTAEFGPALPPDAAVTVKAVDPAGNEATGTGTVPGEVTHHAHDFNAPTLTITDNIDAEKANGDITFTIKPSEKITGLGQNDLKVTNGTIKSFTSREDGGADVVVTPTPGTDGKVTLNVPEGAANAVVGGKPTAAASHEQGVDTKAPTISGVTVEQHDTSNPADMTPEKTVVKFKGDDPTATYTVTGPNGEKAKVTGPDADGNYTAEFGPALPPNAAVTVKGVDPAGNEAIGNGTVPDEVTHHVYDFNAPTLIITDNVDGDKANGDITFTIKPSEKITGLTQDDLQVTNGTIKSFTPREDGGADVVVTPTPGTDGKVTLNVPEGAANAVVGGKPTAAASHEQGVDTKAPTISDVTVEQHDTSDPADMTPEKTVVKFKGDDPTATYTVTGPNGEKAKITGPDADGNYTAEFGPALPPDAAVTVKAVDPAGNEAIGNGTVPAEVTHHAHDFASPTLTITDNIDGDKANGDITFTIKPSEKITGLGQNDLKVTNGTIKSFTPREDGGADVVVTPTPGTDGKVTLNVPEGAATAVVGGKPTAAASHEQGVDTKAPTITGVTVEQHDTSDPADMTPEKTVVKFKGDDPTATYTVTGPNGEKAKVTGPDADGNYTAEFGPALPPNAAVTVKGVDPAGNEATGNGTVPAEVTHHAHDFATPTLTITDNVDAEKTNGDVTFTIKPSAKISGLGQDDLTVTNGTIKSFTPREDGGADVVVTPTPGTDGKITLNVPEGAATAVVGGKPSAAASHEQGTDTKGPVISDVTVEQRDTSDPADMTPEKTLVKFKGDDPDATYTAKAGDKVGTVVKQPDGSYVATFEPALPKGTVVTVEGTDVTGNKGTADSPAVPVEANTHDHEFATPTLTITDNIDGDKANGDITFTIKPSEKITGLTQDDLKVNNGTIKFFTPREDGGADVVVTPTPGTDGKVTLNVPEGAATAVVGGKPTAAASHEQGIDTKGPVISGVTVEQHDTSDPADMTPEKTVVKFKGDDPTATYTVTGPNGEKAKVTGPDVDGNYTAEFGPALPPDAAVTVKAVDPAGNEATGNGTVPAEVTHHEHDFASPTLAITDNIDGDKTSGDITFTITPSAKITGLGQDDLKVNNGTIKSFTPREDGGADVVVTPTPGTDGNVTLSVPEGAANAVVGGKPTEAASHEQGVDTKAPTISDVTVEQHDTSDPADMTPEKTIVKFKGDDPTATYTVTGPNGEKAKVTGPDADGNYTAEFGPALPPDAAVTVKAVDPSGNVATGNSTVPAEVTHHAHDFASPTLTITDNIDGEKANGDITFTIKPSEKITGLTQDDLQLTNGTIKSFTPREDGGADVVITPIPGTDGKVTLSVPEGAANAVVGGKPTAAASHEQGVDTKAPAISDVRVEQHDTSDPADMTPEKTIVKFKGDDPTATYTVTGPNGEKAKITGPDADGNYTAEFGPALPPNAAVTVKAVDPAGNEATGNGTVPAEVTHHEHDFATPTLMITNNIDGDKTNGDITFTIKPSEKITGLTQEDLTITNGTIKSFTPREDGGADVVVTPTPGIDGKVTLSVPEGAATAVVGGKPTAVASHEQGVDTKAPTISDVTVEQHDTSDPADMTPEKTVVKFKGDDSTATYTVTGPNGEKAKVTGPDADGNYTAEFGPTLPPEAAITVKAVDPAGNEATGNGTVPAEVTHHAHDFATPTLTIADNVDAEKTNGDITFTITPSAKISGLGQDDLTVTNGTIKSFTPREDGGAVVVVTPTPDTDGKVTLSVPEGAATAVVGGKPTATASHEQGVDTKAPAITEISVEQRDTSDPADMTPEKTLVKFKGDDPEAAYTAKAGDKVGTVVKQPDGSYVATFDPALPEGTVVTIEGTDATGNKGTVASPAVPAEANTHDHEFATPTLNITDNVDAEKTNGDITFTITPSAKITGLGQDDLKVTNGTIKSFTPREDGGADVVVTPTSGTDGKVTLSAPEGAATAVVGGKPTAAASHEQGVDTKAPTISDVTVEQHDTSDPADMTPEKTVVKFKGDDPTATYTVTGPNGEKAKVTGPDADGNYTAEFGPALSPDAAITVKAVDPAGNEATGNATVPAEVTHHAHDFATPTLTITDNVDAEKTNGDITFTITPSAKITGLGQDDLTVTNGTIKSFTPREDGGADVVVTPAPGTDGKVTLNVPEGAATAVVGGKPTAAASHEQGVDTKAPAITEISVEQRDTSDPADMTPEKTIVKFKGDDPEATYTAKAGDKVGTVVKQPDGSYVATFEPALPEGTVVTIEGTDGTGNQGTADSPAVPAEANAHDHDFATPTLNITDNVDAEKTNGDVTFTITPSAKITGLEQGDLNVANGTIKSFTPREDGGADVVVTPTPGTDGKIILSVPEGAANAVVGGKPTTAASHEQGVDTKAPTISDVRVEQHDTSNPADMTPEKTIVKFKGDDPAATYTVTGPKGEKAKVTGPDADGNYTAEFGPALSPNAAVTVKGVDPVGNEATGNGTVPAEVTHHAHEFAAPTLTVTDNIAANVTKDEITFTIKPSQPIRGLGVDDLTVANGTIKAGSFTNTADGGATVVVTPNANLDNQPVTLTVKANAANAVMGNKPTAQVSGSQLVDTKAPAAPTVTANEDGTVLVRLPDANSAKPGDKVEVKVLPEGAVDGAAPTVVTLTKNADGSWTSDRPDTVPNVEAGKTDAVIPADKVKDHTQVSAKAYDPVGNQSATSQDMAKSIPLRPLVLTLAEDTKGEGTAGTANDNVTKNPTINVSNLVAGKAWEYSIDGGPWKDGSGSSFDLPSNSTPDGRLHRVKARIKGHPAETTSNELAVTLDQYVKAGTLMLGDSSNLVMSNVEAGAYYRITDMWGNEIAKGVANAQGMVTTNRRLNAGRHIFKLHLTDKAGNLLDGKQVVEKTITVGHMDQIYHPASVVKKPTENWGTSQVRSQIDQNPDANNVILVGKVAAGGSRQDGSGHIVAGTGGGLGKQALNINTHGGDDAIYGSRLTATVGNREVNVDMGKGNDSLIILGSGKEASTGYIAAHGGLKNSININMGDGDDYISSLSAGIADQSSISINMGRGNDLLHLKKESGGWSLNAIAGITSGRINIDMGADDDVVILEGRVFKFATIDGGSGYDKIYLGGKNEGTITGFEEISYSLPSGYSARGRFRRAADVDTEPSEKAALKLSDVLGGQSTSLVNGKEIKALFINGNGSLDIDKSENHQVEALNLSKGDTLYKEGYSTYYDKVEDVYVYVASTMSII